MLCKCMMHTLSKLWNQYKVPKKSQFCFWYTCRPTWMTDERIKISSSIAMAIKMSFEYYSLYWKYKIGALKARIINLQEYAFWSLPCLLPRFWCNYVEKTSYSFKCKFEFDVECWWTWSRPHFILQGRATQPGGGGLWPPHFSSEQRHFLAEEPFLLVKEWYNFFCCIFRSMNKWFAKGKPYRILNRRLWTCEIIIIIIIIIIIPIFSQLENF